MEKYIWVAYNDDYHELLCFNYQNKERSSSKKIGIPTSDSEKQRIALSRAKQKLREYCFCNNFEYFVTLTVNSFNADRYSLRECQSKCKKIFKKIKRKYKDFRYVFITENHKDGAFHFHGLIAGIPSDNIFINKNNYLYLEEFQNELGFNSLIPFDNSARFINYIIKYVEKNPIRNDANYIYMSSRGLKGADRFELSPINIDDFPNVWSNEYLKKSSFYSNEITRENFIDLAFCRKRVENHFSI